MFFKIKINHEKILLSIICFAIPYPPKHKLLKNIFPHKLFKKQSIVFPLFFCHKELIRLIQNVQNCYKTANQNSPDIEICVAGDLILMMATIDRQIPSNLHTSFVSENAFNDRIKKNTDLPYFFGNQHSRYATDKGVALMYYIGDGLAPYIDEMHPLQSLSQHCHK